MPEVTLESLEGTIAVAPMLVFANVDNNTVVQVPFEEVVNALIDIEMQEKLKFPDDVVIIKFGNHQLEFFPGEPSEHAIKVLKWFRSALQSAGDIGV
jgi:hypothetical protein